MRSARSENHTTRPPGHDDYVWRRHNGAGKLLVLAGEGGGGLFGRNPQRHQQQLHKISTAGHVLLALAVRVFGDPGEEPGLRLKSWRKQTLVREDVRHTG